MFRRRQRQNLAIKLRECIWPEMGYRRAWTYLIHRVSRIRATPHSIACGFAWGAAVSFLPLWGLHIVLAVICAYLTRGSIIAGALGTAIGNPLTFPVFIFSTHVIGEAIVGDAHPDGLTDAVSGLAVEFSEPLSFMGISVTSDIARDYTQLFVGGLICVPFVWAGFYFTLKTLIPLHLKRRKKRREKRRLKAKLREAKSH